MPRTPSRSEIPSELRSALSALKGGQAKLWILLVSVHHYDDPRLPSLPYAAIDCQNLAYALTQATRSFPERTIAIHHDLASRTPTLGAVRESLQEIAEYAQPQDTVLFYFCGHGALEPRLQQAVFCLADTQKDALLKTGMSAIALLGSLGNCKAKRQVVWLDTCHSDNVRHDGSDHQTLDRLDDATVQLIEILRRRAAQHPGFDALLSCDNSQQSWKFPELGHGVFTHYLVQGLQGEAADAQGIIDTDGLCDYVYSHTLQYINQRNQKIRVANQQKQDWEEQQPEYTLQKPKRVVKSSEKTILGVELAERSVPAAEGGSNATLNNHVQPTTQDSIKPFQPEIVESPLPQGLIQAIVAPVVQEPSAPVSNKLTPSSPDSIDIQFEQRQREEAERLRLQKAAEERQREEAERQRQQIEQRQREEAERLKLQKAIEQRQREEAERRLQLQKAAEERQREEAERQRQQIEQRQHEEAERLKLQKAIEQRQREEAERLRLQKAAEEQRQREEAERRLQLQKAAEEQRQREEAERQRQQIEQRQREEAERLKLQKAAEEQRQREQEEAERLRLQKAAEERQREEAERQRQQIEQRQREEAERLKLQKAAEEQRQREEAERLKLQKAAEEQRQREQEEAERLRLQKAAEEQRQREQEEAERLQLEQRRREEAERRLQLQKAAEERQREEAERQHQQIEQRQREEAERLQLEQRQREEAERCQKAAKEQRQREKVERQRQRTQKASNIKNGLKQFASNTSHYSATTVGGLKHSADGLKQSAEQFTHHFVEQQHSPQVRKIVVLALGGVGLLACGMAASSFYQQRNVQLSEIRALSTTSENLSSANQSQTALVAALQMGHRLQKIDRPWNFLPEPAKIGAIATLQQAIFRSQTPPQLGQPTVAIADSSDGQRLATASPEGVITLWNKGNNGNWTSTTPLSGHSATITQLQFSPDGKSLASASVDKTIKLWNIEKGILIKTLPGHGDRVTAIRFRSDGGVLASGSADQTIKLWTIPKGDLVETLKAGEAAITAIDFSADGRILATGSSDNTLRLWYPESNQPILLGRHNESPDPTKLQGITDVRFSPDGKAIASAGWDKTIKLWTVSDGKPEREASPFLTLTGHSRPVSSISFKPDGQILASGSQDKTINLWNLRSGTVIKTLVGHQDTVENLSFDAKGTALTSVSDRNGLIVWDLNLATLIKQGCNQLRQFPQDISESDLPSQTIREIDRICSE